MIDKLDKEDILPSQSTKLRSYTNQIAESLEKFHRTMQSPTVQTVLKNPLARFILTFVALHTIAWVSMFVHSHWCIDHSFMGYFRNMINGHGPVCHTLLTIAYHSSNNIYALISSALVASGVSWITNRISPQEK